MTPGGEDYRERIRVFLIAADQKYHKNLYCMGCGMKVCEIDDTIVYVTDSSDETVIPADATGAVTLRCGGKWCKKYYEIVLRPSKW